MQRRLQQSSLSWQEIASVKKHHDSFPFFRPPEGFQDKKIAVLSFTQWEEAVKKFWTKSEDSISDLVRFDTEQPKNKHHSI